MKASALTPCAQCGGIDVAQLSETQNERNASSD